MIDDDLERDKYPRVLLLDWTPMGGGTATGELKSSYFDDWSCGRLLHVFAGNGASFGCFSNGKILEAADEDIVLAKCKEFNPEVIIYRPVAERDDFSTLSLQLIKLLCVPYAVWLMDDWPDQQKFEHPAVYKKADEDLKVLLEKAARCFVISESMAKAFKVRYKQDFSILRNGVLIDEWTSARGKNSSDEMVIRYAGSLADHTASHSVERVAEAVEELSNTLPIRLEVRTQKYWYDKKKEAFARFNSTKIALSTLSPLEYKEWLMASDLLVVAYNYNERTHKYLKYSFANKIPECLASGVPLLVHGPRELSSVGFLAESGAVMYVEEPEIDRLVDAIRQLYLDIDLRRNLGEKGRALAFDKFNLEKQKKFLFDNLVSMKNEAQKQVSCRPPENDWSSRIGGEHQYTQTDRVQLNEPKLLARLMEAKVNVGTMVDVGAHRGGSLGPFASSGWRVLAFEPDPENLEALRRNRFAKLSNVEIVPCAVGDREMDSVSIYSSDESTGVSGLTPFLSTHSQVAEVPMVTLERQLQQRSIGEVKFLKIDVEGHEMDVLRGIDFSKVMPEVVMLEYEDGKTQAHGYDRHDLARFLTEKGYSVIVSEWWPIEKYGARHSWRRLIAYPCEIPEQGWGNLIGFLNPPSEEIIGKVLDDCLEMPAQPVTSQEKPSVPGRWMKIALDSPSKIIVSTCPGVMGWLGGFLKRNLVTVLLGCLILSGIAIVCEATIENVELRSLYVPVVLAIPLVYLSLEYSKYLFRKACTSVSFENERVLRETLQKIDEGLSELNRRCKDSEREIGQRVKSLRESFAKRDNLYSTKFEEYSGSQSDSMVSMLRQISELESRVDSFSEKVASDLSDFKKETTFERETYSSRIEGQFEAFDRRHEEVGRSVNELSFKLGSAQSETSKFEAEISVNTHNIKQLLETREKLEVGLRKVDEETRGEIQKIRNLCSKASGSNANLARVHRRLLLNDEIERILDYWLPHLGLTFTKRSIAYLAHKVCLIEDSVEGRMATEISTAILRLLALRSLRASKIEVLETGTLFGIGSGILHRLSGEGKKVRFTLIDPLEGYYGKGKVDPITGVPVSRKILEQNLMCLGLKKTDYRILQNFSDDPEAIAQAKTRKYDYVLFDGDHSYEGVAKDFELYSPMINEGGLMLFDDYDTTDWPDIKRFVDEHVKGNAHWKLIGSEWRTAIFQRVSGSESAD